MYQLTDMGPDDGGLVCIPGSCVSALLRPRMPVSHLVGVGEPEVALICRHKGFFNMPPDVRAFETLDRFGPDTGGALIKSVPCKAGSALSAYKT